MFRIGGTDHDWLWSHALKKKAGRVLAWFLVGYGFFFQLFDTCFYELCDFFLAVFFGFLLFLQMFFDFVENVVHIEGFEYVGVCAFVYGFNGVL